MLLKSATQKLIKENIKIHLTLASIFHFTNFQKLHAKYSTRLTLYKPIEFICKFFENTV